MSRGMSFSWEMTRVSSGEDSWPFDEARKVIRQLIMTY